jgi:hypothetical protein
MLSSQDASALARLRLAEKRWNVMRWIVVAAGLAMLGEGLSLYRGSSVSGLSVLRNAALNPGPPTTLPAQLAFQFGLLASQGFVFVLLGFGVVFYVLGRWKGDPARRLLIRLVGEREESR